MVDKQSDAQQGEENKDVQILAPDMSIKDKMGRGVNAKDVITKDKVKIATGVIESSSKDLIRSVKNDLKSARTIFNELEKEKNTALVERLMSLILSIKSISGMVKYPLATAVAKSLYRYCSGLRAFNNVALVIIHSHMQTLEVIYRDEVMDDGGDVGRELLDNLIKSTESTG